MLYKGRVLLTLFSKPFTPQSTFASSLKPLEMTANNNLINIDDVIRVCLKAEGELERIQEDITSLEHQLCDLTSDIDKQVKELRPGEVGYSSGTHSQPTKSGPASSGLGRTLAGTYGEKRKLRASLQEAKKRKRTKRKELDSLMSLFEATGGWAAPPVGSFT